MKTQSTAINTFVKVDIQLHRAEDFDRLLCAAIDAPGWSHKGDFKPCPYITGRLIATFYFRRRSVVPTSEYFRRLGYRVNRATVCQATAIHN